MESLSGLKRTHMCAEVTEKLIGETVTVMGWVNKRRDLGQLIFVTLRDKTGIVQAFVNENEVEAEFYEKVKSVRGEYVLAITGVVIARTEKNINENMLTGKIEIEAKDLKILSTSEVPPFQVADTGVNEELRMRYRYIDLRRPELQKKFFIRHKVSNIIRHYYSENGFTEIETPMLTKSTPEGARDYLVASRLQEGGFYALPQSPQLFKQLLMISGFDRYFQIVKCFRDEDLRADRQPEFTQIDMEMSFVDAEEVMEMNEGLLRRVFKEVLDYDIEENIIKMPYKEAMERFGVDKPDLRYGMELTNITDIVKGSEFVVFENAINSGGSVRGIKIENGNKHFSRKKIDSLVEYSKDFKGKGLAWINITEDGENKSTIGKFFDDDKIEEIKSAFNAKNGDLILISADKDNIVFDVLGNLRVEVARILGLVKEDEYKILWVTDFPLFEYDEEDGRFYAKHHPFTAPKDEDLNIIDTDKENARAKAYDLVINGQEVMGGSIRIYNPNVQEKMFKALGFTEEEANEQFGFFIEAFKYGAPPHGGVAWGLDRLIMILTGTDSIRDVVAFPKTKEASCLLTNAPSQVDVKQLLELHLNVIREDGKKN